MNINKMIFKYLFEIFSLILIIFVTYPIWQVLAESKGASIAKSYENFESEYLTLYIDKIANLNDIYPKEDHQVNMNNYTSVNIVNNSKDRKRYKLVISFNKNYEIIDFLKVNIGDKTYFLNELYLSSGEYINYYVLDEGSVLPNSTENKKIVLWLSSNTSNLLQGKNFDFNFQLIDI